MMDFYFYLNDDHSTRPCTIEEWSKQFEEMSRNDTKHVLEETINNYWISTVWLGLNHSYNDGIPLIFETMVFDSNQDGIDAYMDRYTTWDEAVDGHKKAVEWVMNGCKDKE